MSPLFAAAVIVAVLYAVVVVAAAAVWQPRRVSTATRAVSSGRKPGRTRADQ